MAAVTGGAAGCGRAGPGLNVAVAYARTVSAGTAQTAVNVHVGAPRAGTYVTAQGRVDLGGPDFALAVQEAGMTFGEMGRGNHLYVEVPVAARAANRGKPWAEFQLQGSAGAGTSAGPVLTEVDPVPVLGLLRLAPTSTARLGRRRLNGQAATEYRLEYSAAKLEPASPGGALPAGLASLLVQIANPRPAEVPVNVWVDSSGRVVQLQLNVTLATEPRSPVPAQADLANQLPATLSADIYLGHFGEPVHLVPPAADRTNKLAAPQLAGGAL